MPSICHKEAQEAQGFCVGHFVPFELLCGDNSKTTPDQVGHLDEERPRVAPEAGYDFSRERVPAVVVQVVVVTGIESRARARRPAEKRLRSQTRVERVVVENQPRKSGLRELIRAARSQDVDGEGDTVRVVASQPL